MSVVNMSHGVYWLCNREDDKFVPARMIKRACDKQFMAVCQRFGWPVFYVAYRTWVR